MTTDQILKKAATVFNLGNKHARVGELKKAEENFIIAIELEPNNASFYNNLGNVQKQMGRLDEAEKNYRKVIELEPNNAGAHYNLGISLYIKKHYKKAADEFRLINANESQNYLLKCFLELNEKSNLIKQLNKMINQGKNNPVIGSMVSRSKIRYGVDIHNPFCNEPLDYVIKTDLTKLCDFKKIFIETSKNILKDNAIINKTQSLLINGTQTSGNLFSQKNDLVEKMKDIIDLEIKKYRENFKDSKEGFLKNWPQSYYLNGWLVSMKNGGKLSPHMHDYGWLSGSIYINVPPKKKADSGNLVVCIDDKESDKNSKKSIDVVTGSFCLFPASLLHYTIPFLSDEERIVLAFDVVPK